MFAFQVSLWTQTKRVLIVINSCLFVFVSTLSDALPPYKEKKMQRSPPKNLIVMSPNALALNEMCRIIV